LRIVTFCAHQPYLHLFAGMDLTMDVVQLANQRRFLQNWRDAVRPLPEGWRLIDWDEAKRGLSDKRYDVALAHNASDYIDFLPYSAPRIMVIHSALSGRLAEDKNAVDPEQYKREFHRLIKKSRGVLVFISKQKREDWGLPGAVIPNAVDGRDYDGYHGADARILRVANLLAERGDVLDYPAHQRLTAGLPTTLVGDNPAIDGAVPAPSWDALKDQYRRCRVYLHTAVPGREDGFNLAMLEAMTTGMPVVATAHPSSPIVDGVNGFVSADLDYLRDKLELLLQDQALAQKLGAEARQTALRQFNAAAFHSKWEDAFRRAIRKR